MLKRLREADDRAYAEGSAAAPKADPAVAPFDALGAIAGMMGADGVGGGTAPAVAPAPAPVPEQMQGRGDSRRPSPVAGAAGGPIAADVAAVAPAAPITAVEQGSGGDATRPEVAVLLEQVGPIFQAAMVYPGASSPPTEFAAAIRRMSETTAALTRQIVQSSKEADETWALERVQPSVARLVAEEWRIAAALFPANVDREMACPAAVTIERLRPPVLASLDVRGLLHANGSEAALPIEAVAVAARLCSEASMYASRVEQFVPGMDVSPDLFLLNAVQFVQGETAAFQQRFRGGGRDVAAAFQVNALQSVALAFGRHSKGVMRAMADAETLQKRDAVAALLASDAFKSGFPTSDVLSDARVVIQRMAAMVSHVLRSLAGERP